VYSSVSMASVLNISYIVKAPHSLYT